MSEEKEVNHAELAEAYRQELLAISKMVSRYANQDQPVSVGVRNLVDSHNHMRRQLDAIELVVGS